MKNLAAIFICLSLAAPSIAGIIYVDANGTGDYPTIQAAINYAVNGDTVLVADGTYTGSGYRDIDFKGKSITLRSENGPENCIIDVNCPAVWLDPMRRTRGRAGRSCGR